MGLSLGSTANLPGIAASARPGGLRGWLALLSPRDRVIYGVLLTVILLVIGIYLVLAVQLLLQNSSAPMTGGLPAPTLTPPSGQADAAPPAQTEAATPAALPAPTVQQTLTLYFADASGTLLVPVSRAVSFPADSREAAALRELVRGPIPGSPLTRTVVPDVGLIDPPLLADTGTLTINLNRPPGDQQAIDAIVLTLTEFPEVRLVRLLVDGREVGLPGVDGPIGRLNLNLDNPQGLDPAFDSRNRFLTLYFLPQSPQTEAVTTTLQPGGPHATAAADYYIRITRLVTPTPHVGRVTVEELLRGPGPYADRLRSPIPSDTALRDIWRDGAMAIVDLSGPFAEAPERDAALDVLVLSLTGLSDGQGGRFFHGVRVLVDGRPLTEFWGAAYDQAFFRPPPLNPEPALRPSESAPGAEAAPTQTTE